MTEFQRFKKGLQAVLSVPPDEAKRIREEHPILARTRANKKRPATEVTDRED